MVLAAGECHAAVGWDQESAATKVAAGDNSLF